MLTLRQSILRYHIKYMYVGDLLKNETETIIRRLRPALQMRLRFITHLNIEEITSAPVAATGTSATGAQATATPKTVAGNPNEKK